MKNVKIIILIFFALMNFKALSQTFDEQSLSGWKKYELAELNCSSKMHCAVLECSTLYPSPSQALQYMNCIRDKGDFEDDMPVCFSDLETDTRGCLNGSKSPETPFNGGVYWQCSKGDIKIGCTDDNAELPNPVCGEKPKECENGNSSDFIQIGDSFVWTCSINDKTEICETDKYELYPRCNTQSYRPIFGAVEETPDCINGRVRDVNQTDGTYRCENEWASVNCEYDGVDYTNQQQPRCGSTVRDCAVGDVVNWDGGYIHHCQNQFGNIGCNFTPPVCDNASKGCKSPGFIVGGINETSTQYNWTCRRENNAGGFERIVVDRDCSSVKPIAPPQPPPEPEKCYEYERYMTNYEDVPFECQKADRNLPVASETSPNEVGIIKNRPYAGFGNCYIDRFLKNEISCDSPAVEDPINQ